MKLDGRGRGRRALDEWRQGGRAFEFGGHEIFYRDEGGGPDVLLLIHGFPTASWDWHQLWPELTRRFRCIAADMLGFGFSAKPRGHGYSLFEQADLQEALLAGLGVRRAHVLAHDYGDTVAQELLARQLEEKGRGGGERQEGRPFWVRSVCLLNGGIFPEAIRRQPIQCLLEGPLGGLVARLVTEGRFRRSFSAVFGPATRPSDEELLAFWSLIEHGQGRRVIHGVSRYQHERRRHRDRWVGALQRCPVPLRFVVGPADPVSGAAMAQRFEELILAPDLVMLDEAVGHYPQIEAPDEVLAALGSFWRHAAGETGGH